ncbi:E3 ubiquitin/ISG15 ligase TRIM25-like [Ranitomeya variabilis]|uniref:E3 ubiquitin/ISG15 ligase TRIM25-like n=1 Tax=Ranitomeya variabilis TaxID=490064 RepID=UPI004055C2B0
MASAGLRRELECPICLTLYTDPVILRCGHNFCRVCIDRVLNTQEGSGVYSCPECREEFQERPVLIRNITLCNILEDFLSTQLHQMIGICCTYCVDSPVPAVKSCLLCEASLCDNHLRVHSKGPEHVLTDPSTSLETRKCSVHKKILEYYCTEDAACICVSCCLIGEHRGHKVETLDEASKKRKTKLGNFLQKLTTKREETMEKVWHLEENWRKGQEKMTEEKKSVSGLFIEIRRRVDDLEKKVLSDISSRQEKVLLSLADVIQKLEIKKDELSRKMRHIEELCNMTDPLTVLQEPDTGDLCDPEEEEEGDEDTGGHDGGDQGAELISNIPHTLSAMIRDINVTFHVQDPADILLDVNTAANNLLISDDLKTMSRILINQNRRETAKRFQEDQVLSSSRFFYGRHYWDVEVSRSGVWRVGMCYPSIDRRGRQSYIGHNQKSWCLCGGRQVYNNQCSVIHHSQVIPLPHQISSDRIRIYLDYEAGQLSFYELCDPIRHLHTFTATFSEPLHAALCVHKGCIKLSGWGSRNETSS